MTSLDFYLRFSQQLLWTTKTSYDATNANQLYAVALSKQDRRVHVHMGTFCQ